MFQSFLQPQGSRQSRSKSPSGRQPRDSYDHRSTTDEEDDSKYRRTSRAKYSESDSDNHAVPDTPRYEERTPDAYGSSKRDDRRPSARRGPDDNDRKYRQTHTRQKSYADSPLDDERPARGGRQERGYYDDDVQTPRAYTNGAAPTSTRPPYASDGNVPGAFPGQLNAPQARPQVHARSKSAQYESVGKFQYAQPDPKDIQYNYNTDHTRQPSFSKAYDAVNPQPTRPTVPVSGTRHQSYYEDQSRQVKYAAERQRDEEDDRSRPITTEARQRRQSYQRERSRSPNPAVSPHRTEQLRQSLGRLSTGGGLGATLGVNQHAPAGGRPPASPLLEAYKGTYQTISPLPSPLALIAHRGHDDLSDLDLSSDEEKDELRRKIKQLEKEKQKLQRSGRGDPHDVISPRSSGLQVAKVKGRTASDASSMHFHAGEKKVMFYDANEDAKKIADGLKGTHHSADYKPLLKILPWLTTDEMILLKTAYKTYAKINGQGINLSKHIKARIPGNLGKCLYATSLGQYESDAYWANCFYQSGASRRELLIESLVGRSNQQIREIKDVFKDKRYDDDLEKCMKAELKADKFRAAILLSMEERRMPEGLALDMRHVRDDAEDLHEALNSAGGETAMIKIILTRSDDHLREVMRYYEKTYKRNFARDMIAKSRNLVGETLAHILNGALNRPMRDALLLHQAMQEFSVKAPTTPGGALTKAASAGRAELLISRVIRLHWDPKHQEKVKKEYERRYGETVVRALMGDVQSGMKTEEGKAWVGFCVDLIRSSE